MSSPSRRFRPVVLLAMVALLFSAFAAPVTAKPAKPPKSPIGTAERVVMFASDGMRPDLMQKYAKEGVMPTYAKLMKDGVTGDNGMLQAFPPNTGVGWFTMATGTYPADHGSTNNTYFRAGDSFVNRTSFSAAGVLQADTIADAAERAGKKVAQIDWVAGAASGSVGPVVDFTNFFTNRGVLVGVGDPVEQAGSAFFGVNYQDAAELVAADAWSNVPAGDPAAPPKEATWAVPSSFAAQNPSRTYNVYFYDSVVGGGAVYDHVIVSPVGKTGAGASVDLAVGDFEGIKLMGGDGLIGPRLGQTAGHYVKLISIAPDASQFKLYLTSLTRAIARCGAVCNSLPAGAAGEDRLEKYIADNLPPWSAGDFAPLEAAVIDEDTYVEQGRDLERTYSLAVINFILGTLQPDTDLAMVGYPFTDEVSHQFLGLVSPTDSDGNPNPCYDVNPKFDDVQCVGRGTAGRVAAREGYIRSGYADADEKLGIARSLMGGNPTTFAGSDHGFAPAYYAVNANAVLNQASVTSAPAAPAVPATFSLRASSGIAQNCNNRTGAPTIANDIAKACWAGGTVQIYINPARLRGSSATADPSWPSYAEVRAAIKAAFDAVTDPAHPGAQVVLKVMMKEELRNVDGSDSLHPNRSGDVVVVLRPPYQSDAGTDNVKVSLSHFFGQHGYMPNTVDLANNINMHGTFVLAGAGVKHKANAKNLRAVDIAPTLSLLMGIAGPQNARGAILYDLLHGGDKLKEVTILDVSDWHAQLTPLAEAADNIGTLTFSTGGSAFYKTWFDIYEAEAQRNKNATRVLEVMGGDSFGGATPPISNFFGDTPTPPIMAMMGIDIDAIGNHSFDRGEQYLRNTLIPLAKFPMISSNIVFPDGKTPKEWSKSKVIDVGKGVKVGFVGFTTESTPEVVFPGNLGPFEVRPIIPAVNDEAAKLAKKTNVIVALGHEGATAGTITSPTGPLIDLADAAVNIDAVIGDHNDLQVNAVRSNGVIVTENRGKGLRFTRIRLVVADGKDGGVVYKTADFHKPWTIGLTPDAAIQAKIDELNAALAPILGTQIGESTKRIPRADQCGSGDGRLCESLVGDLVTDAMRTKYASIGADFAITNSGGLRADLTCPVPDINGDFCPSYTPSPNHIITRGQNLAVLPFGNIAVTVPMTGAELKAMLENGVSRSVSLDATPAFPGQTPPLTGPPTLLPSAQGRFPQVSGLCFTWSPNLAPGSRVTSVVYANDDGTCTTDPVDVSASAEYLIVQNDFTAAGGDGYPIVTSRMTSQDILEQVLADYVTANTPVSPVVRAAPNGRINCLDTNGTDDAATPAVVENLPNCPTLTPSP